MGPQVEASSRPRRSGELASTSSQADRGTLVNDSPLPRVGFVGGLPPGLGGGGLDLRMRRTADALTREGASVRRLEESVRADVDIVHAFGATPPIWFALQNWSHNRVPLVLSPVLVDEPRHLAMALEGAALRLRIGYRTTANMKYETVRRADLLIALTQTERGRLLSNYGVAADQIRVVPNGTDIVEELLVAGVGPAPETPYLLMVGAISGRKRQADVVRALPEMTLRVAGPFLGGDGLTERSWLAALSGHPRATWLGNITDRTHLVRLHANARALILYSRAEGLSNAVLDSLALGVPVVVAETPANTELARLYPDLVVLVRDVPSLQRACQELRHRTDVRPPAAVATWPQVAQQLLHSYATVLRG